MAMDDNHGNFPVWGLLPKKETGVTTFLTENPDYNGKNVTIAIFDSGVDPGAPGLKETPDGKVKVLERFDCSGCGDVSMTTIVEPKEGVITGISGKQLKIPESWKNPTNKYRVGIKNSFDLYPERLKERMQEEHKKKQWENQHAMVSADALRQLNSFESKNTNGHALSEEEKLAKDNLEATVDHLASIEKKYHDSGRFYDCVMFHDGEKWMACVDTTENGELEKCKLLGEYSVTHEFAPLNEADQLNFSINVHDDGNVLELVGLCSSHGTHVASITSAYFPEEPEKNGVAPGAQIISLSIGDGRLGSMETGTAMVRAIIKVMELKEKLGIDVINMSYGEHAHWSNAGRIGELMNEVVNKYGIVWVASAGNHGPALSTIGTPPDISQETLIGVGAYVSPDMMLAEYSMRAKLPGMPYTWSSRGPTIEGGLGVTVCAPGGAITSVPNFTLRNSQLMNGTSMASPHVAGAVGVLISGLRQKKIPYSPYSIKRALENGATSLEDVELFAQGNGLLNVEKSFDLLVNHSNAPERDVRFHVTCGGSAKGIYIRNKPPKSIFEGSISVEPHFLDSDAISPNTKIDFNLKLTLRCKENYVEHPAFLDLSNMTRVFGIKIDVSGLQGLNTTFIEAYDVACLSKGPVFKVPVTIIIPQDVPASNALVVNSAQFEANTISRNFITVPDLATWAVIKMRALDKESIGKFVVHTMQLLPKQNCKAMEINKHVTVTYNSESSLAFPVQGSKTLEVVIAKYWANIGSIDVQYSIHFFGVKPNQPSISMIAADGVQNVHVTTLQGEDIQPVITLKNAVQVLRPSDSKILSLTKRDVIPPGRQIYELQLTYNFHLNKGTEVSPNCPLLSDVLYESEFESQLWMIYDNNKQFMGCGDAYPSKYNVKLEKGDYVLKMHVRHDKKDHLEKLNEAQLLLSQKLASNITLDCYANYSQALINGKKGSLATSFVNNTVPFYIAPLAADKYSAKTNNTAHHLTGSITYAKDDVGKRVDTYPIKYILPEASKKATKPQEKAKTKAEEFKEALRELKITWLKQLDASNGSDALYNEMLKEFPDYLPTHTAYLQSLDAMESKKQLPLLEKEAIMAQKEEDIKKIITICDKALENIYNNSLLMFFSIKNDQRCDAAQIKQLMDRQKTVYIDCLARKGIANCRLYLISSEDPTRMENITTIWKSLLQFVDPNDSKTFQANAMYFACWHATVFKHHGRLLKYLQRIIEEKPTRDVEEKIHEIYKLQGWEHLVRYHDRLLLAKYPHSYRLF